MLQKLSRAVSDGKLSGQAIKFRRSVQVKNAIFWKISDRERTNILKFV